jgi:hypothetical protein
MRKRKLEYMELRDVETEEWIKRIDTIEDIPLRRTVGWIVWWDYVADRLPGSLELWMILSQYPMDGQPTPEEITRGLVSIGFDEKIAAKRSGQNARQEIQKEST